MKKWIDTRRLTKIFCLFCLSFLVFIESRADAPKPKADEDGYRSISMFMNVMHLIRQNYVDSDKVTYDKLVKGALKGMLRELDPFSSFETPEQYKQIMEQTEGRFGGIGVVVTVRDKMLEVVSPMEDTPGYKAGIQAGDVISEIDGKKTYGLPLSDCVKLMKGEPGTKVKLTIKQKTDSKIKKLEVERADIEVSGVKGGGIIEDGIGYVKLTQFSSPTSSKLEEKLRKLKKKGIRGLILDLRGNPGGLLSSAIRVCSLFLDTGKLVVFTEGRDPSQRRDYYAVNCDKMIDTPMVVLVDERSASASEITAACLQDYHRAVVVGEKTYGKGSVQTVIPMDDSSAVRLTTAKYYTPSEKVIHEEGVSPDIRVSVDKKDKLKLARQQAIYPGQVKPDTDKAILDPQLQRAIEILKGVCLFSEAKKD